MAFILLRLLVLGVIAAAADDVHITWLIPPRGVVPCVVAEAGRAQRRPPPPLDADDRPRAKPYRRRGEEDIASKRLSVDGSVEVSRKRNGTEGVYQCAVRRHGGTVLGYPQHWKFASIEKQFTRHPENGTARVGQPYVLSCEVASAPAASIAWLRNGESLPHDDRYIVVDNLLLFTEVRREDVGAYKCVASNLYLNKNRISNSAWLRVADPEESAPALLPLQQDGNITAPRFSRVQLLCPVLGWPRPKLTWELTAPGSRTATLESTEEVLTLTSLELDQEGVYKCSVDEHPHIFKVFNVSVTEPVVITLPPVSKEVVRVSTVRFNCTATGRPAPTITWYKDGKPLVLGGRFNLRSSISGNRYELVVGDVDSEDAGVYQCFASSGRGAASAWAAAPGAVRCWPAGARAVLVRWQRPDADVMAYTVQTTQPSWPGQPHTNTEETVPVSEPLTTYGFQVRAYIRGADKNLATDRSDPVFCQGQGVPVRITKQDEDTVLVSWQEFAQDTPDVVQWVLQYRPENSTDENNITLAGDVHNYTLQMSSNEPLQVRVLGSKSLEWLPQNLTYLPWTSTTSLDQPGEVTVVPEDVHVSGVLAREVAVRWRLASRDTYAFLVCVRKPDGSRKCVDSFSKSATVQGLEPGTQYALEVQARAPGRGRGGPFSAPLLFTTLSDGPARFKELTWKWENATAARVSWAAAPARHSVSYSDRLDAPVELWRSVETMGNTALITGLDPTKDTYVMVTSYDPQVYSPIKTIPAQVQEAKDLQSSFTRSGVRVSWAGGGAREVRYSQNLTHSLDLWPALNVTGTSIELFNLNPSLPTYVMVAAPGPSQRSQVLTIPPRPAENSLLLLGVGIGVGVLVLLLLAAAAVCIWRKRKRASSPLRSRRRNASENEEEEEEAAEMKSVGGRLANGRSSNAGEPLLNGHVHITENPQTKAPNGKMRKGLIPFDLSRFEDGDTTLETILDADSSGAARALLDTSRPPGEPFPPAEPFPPGEPFPPREPLPPNDSFGKLPDDNMNSELTRSSFPTDNSKIQPTLQPNG